MWSNDSSTNCLLDFVVSSYDECIDILYARNTIQIDSGFVGHLPEVILPQRLSSITSLEVHEVYYTFRMVKKKHLGNPGDFIISFSKIHTSRTSAPQETLSLGWGSCV